MNTKLINQKILKREIESLEDAYVSTVINVIKGPFLIENCNKAKENEVDATEDRKQSIDIALAQNESNHKTNLEALETLEKIIPEVKKLLTK